MTKTCLDKKDVVKILAMIRVNFENAYHGTQEDNQLLVDTWFAVLRNYPRETVYMAAKRALSHAEFVPRVGTIVNEIEKITQAIGKSDAELWNELTVAVGEAERCSYAFRFTARDPNGKTQGENAVDRLRQVYESLSEELKEYVGNQWQLVTLSAMNVESLCAYERSRFLKALPNLRERVKLRAAIPPEMKSLLEGSAMALIGKGGN